MKRTLIILVAMTLLVGVSRAEQGSPEEAYPSPYFIDGIHCQGLRMRAPPTIFIPREQVEMARRVEAQEDCERVAGVFGIQKFMWLTPEDLEKFTNTIRESGYFKSVDVSIKKSELRNHIHLFLGIEPAAGYRFALGDTFQFAPGTSGQGARVFNRLSAEVRDRRHQPLNEMIYGFNLEGAAASQAILPSALGPNYYYGDLYLADRTNYSKSWSSLVAVHLIPNNLIPSGQSRLDSQVNGDLLYTQTFFNTYVTVQWGPSLIVATYGGNPTSYSTTALPGAKVAVLLGKEDWDFLKVDFAYYHVIGLDSAVSDTGFYGKKHFAWLLDGGFFNAGLTQRIARHSQLPPDQFPSPSVIKGDIFLGVGKSFGSEQSLHQGALNVGYQEWATPDTTPYTSDLHSPYLSLEYALSTESWDIKVRASYFFQRVY